VVRHQRCGQADLGAYTDAAGDWLDGGADYTLRVPPGVPAKLFWSITVYDVATPCLIDNEQRPALVLVLPAGRAAGELPRPQLQARRHRADLTGLRQGRGAAG
jgi:hypothetical protein